MSAVLSIPFPILSPCWSTALVGLLLDVVEDAHAPHRRRRLCRETPVRERSPRPRSWPSSAPTAVGKSDLGVALAQRLGGEVVNADSMQLYRGMDVGTAKLTEAEQRGVPTTCSTSGTCRRGQRRRLPADGPGRVRRDARPRRRRRCLSAGPGLYVRAALDRLELPGHRPVGPGAAWRPSWPPTAPACCIAGWPASTRRRPSAILPSNGRRLVRALEVVELTGRPVTASLPDARVRGPRRPGRLCRAAPGARRADRAPGRRDVGARPGRRGAAAGRDGAARGPDRAPGPRLRAGAAAPRRGVDARSRLATRRCGPPGGSRGGRSRGSAATRASSGSTPAGTTSLRQRRRLGLSDSSGS